MKLVKLPTNRKSKFYIFDAFPIMIFLHLLGTIIKEL